MSTLGEFLAHLQTVEVIPCPEAEEWADLINRISVPGRIVEVTEDTYWYFLEVLPPKHMRCSMFAFAEGAEAIRLFWRKDQKHFCQQLTDNCGTVHVTVRYRGDIHLRFPLQCTSLSDLAKNTIRSKLTAEAVRELLAFVKENEPCPHQPRKSGKTSRRKCGKKSPKKSTASSRR